MSDAKDLTDEEAQALDAVEGFSFQPNEESPVVAPVKKTRGRKKKVEEPAEETPAVELEVEDLGRPDEQEGLEEVEEDDRPEPLMSSPEWSEFVQRQFEDDEVDQEGHPYVHGLRRVANLLLGPTLRSEARLVQSPSFGNSGKMQPACVEYTVEILMQRLEHGINEPYGASFTEVADVYEGNTDAEFARFPSGMAATRAEGRAYRKALMLKRVVSSEEKTLVPLGDSGTNGMIHSQQINFIDVLCRRTGVDVMKYINSGKTVYDKIEEVSYESARLMTEHLSGWQNDPSKIPDRLKPYKVDWRNRE